MMRDREPWSALAVLGGVAAASVFYLANGHLAGTAVRAATDGMTMHFLTANVAALVGAGATGLLLPHETGVRRTTLPLVTWTACTILFMAAIASEPSTTATHAAWLER